MYFHADAEHPDWAPLWNPVYTLQPNPDDIYVSAPITRRPHLPGFGQPRHLQDPQLHHPDGAAPARSTRCPETTAHNELDTNDLGLGLGEDFEILFSAEQPGATPATGRRSTRRRKAHVHPLPQL